MTTCGRNGGPHGLTTCVGVISKWGRLHFLSVFGHYIKCFLCLLRYINKMLLLTI